MNTLFKSTLLLLPIFLFTACSSKNEININKEINSFSLDKNIYIAGTPKTVKSPLSINLGLGGYVSKHVGIHMGTTVRPDISNDDGMNLQRGISKYNISLEDLIKSEFKNQMSNDRFYKNKYVPFGADYIIYLSVLKYEFDDSLFSSKTQAKIYMDLNIRNKSGDIIYSDKQTSSVNSEKILYTQAQILRSGTLLNKTLNQSITNILSKFIEEMKSK